MGSLILSGVEGRFRSNLGTAIAVSALQRFPLPRENGFLNQFFNLLHGKAPEPGPLADFIVRTCWETDQGVVANRLRGLERFDVTDRLWRIEAPTRILAGSRDVVVPPARQEALARSIAGATAARIEGAGHVGFLTHREEFVRSIRRFLRAEVRSLC